MGLGGCLLMRSGNVGLGTSSPANFAGFVTLALPIHPALKLTLSKDQQFRVLCTMLSDIFYVESKSTVPTAFVINGSERLRITSAGLVGIGTSSPQSILNLSSTGPVITLTRNNSADTGSGAINFASSDNTVRWQVGTNQAVGSGLEINRGAGTNNAVYIDTSNRVGIGTTAPNRKLEVSDAGADNFIRVNTTGATKSGIEFASSGTAYSQLYFTNVSPYDLSLLQQYTTGSLILGTNSTERARIDSSGRLLVGTSSARSNLSPAGSTAQFQVEGVNNDTNRIAIISNLSSAIAAAPAGIYLSRAGSSGIGSTVIVADNNQLGQITFQGCDGTNFIPAASITSEVDGTPGANDMPGRLVFSTTADGAASPTERLRITSAGVLQIADASNITVGTTTGTKIGTATTQKLGFYNATPVVQPTAVADATDAATVITQLNDLLAKLRTLGIIAT
jgi:hypothetical protein